MEGEEGREGKGRREKRKCKWRGGGEGGRRERKWRGGGREKRRGEGSVSGEGGGRRECKEGGGGNGCVDRGGEYGDKGRVRSFLQFVGSRNYRPTWKLNVTEAVAGNYYPVNSRIYIEVRVGSIHTKLCHPEYIMLSYWHTTLI